MIASKRIKLLFSALMIGALLLLLILHSKYALTVSEYSISADTLPEAFDGYHIVQLSDLHAAEFGADNKRLVRKVQNLEPDLIALTGDYIEDESQLPVTAALVRWLSEIAPVYFTSGNHDWASGSIQQLRETVTENGGIYLSNEAVILEQGGQAVILAGVEDPNSRADMIKPDALLEQINAKYPNQYIILLAHRNDFISKYPVLPCDLIFTGHGHGGVVRLPILGGVFGTDMHLFPEYDAGIFPSGRYRMIVSRGLGSSPPLPRFLNPPEIVSVTLHKK